MDITVAQFEQLKKKVECLRSERDKASGELKAVRNTIAKEFGCKSLKEAKELLGELKKEEEELKEDLDEAWEEFDQKWGDKLDGFD